MMAHRHDKFDFDEVSTRPIAHKQIGFSCNVWLIKPVEFGSSLCRIYLTNDTAWKK